MVDYCMDLTRHLVRGAGTIGIEPVIEPIMNVVALKVAGKPQRCVKS
jgi:tyrosine decarboxylase/aspartate 1-decarboxylase